MTIREATELWVQRDLIQIPRTVAQKLMDIGEGADWRNITPLMEGDHVYSSKYDQRGEIVDIYYDDDIEEYVYDVELDTEGLMGFREEDITRLNNSDLPMWGTLWAFKESYECNKCGDTNTLRKIAECGYSIYDSEDYGFVVGIDGCGYDFYEAHWMPLYNIMGFHWHDQEEVD